MNVPVLDQLRKMLEEQREQQYLNMRAIDICVRQDTDPPVAQVRKIRIVVFTVWIDTDSDGDVVNLVIGK